jgi:hypothetical protein
MIRTEPRVQYHFQVVQTPKDTDYVPLPARDSDRVALFEGGPSGIVIATDQKIGSRAVANTFEWAAEEGSEEDMRSASRMFAFTSLGTAYHLYAQRAVQEVMYRQVPLPLAVDLETGNHIEMQHFIGGAQAGLETAADEADKIKKAVVEQRSYQRFEKPLGRVLARTGLTLAAISDNVPNVRGGNAIETQDAVYMSAQLAYAQMMELSGQIGVRPTVAQVANRRSPLMQYLHDNRQSVTGPVYDRLNDEVGQLISDEPRP